jgi:hypothetical protein
LSINLISAVTTLRCSIYNGRFAAFLRVTARGFGIRIALLAQTRITAMG